MNNLNGMSAIEESALELTKAVLAQIDLTHYAKTMGTREAEGIAVAEFTNTLFNSILTNLKRQGRP